MSARGRRDWVRRLLSVCLVLLGSPAAVAQSPDRGPYVPHEVELEGPLESVRWVFSDGGETRLQLDLQTGERRRWKVPLARVWDPEGDGRLEAQGAGRVISMRPWPEGAGAPQGPWALPFVSNAPPVYGGSAWLLAIAWGGLLVAFRRRPLVAVAITAVSALGWAAFGSPASPTAPGTVRWIDRSVGGEVQAIDAARDRLSVDLAALQAVRVSGGSPVRWEGQSGSGPQPEWRLHATGRYLRARYAVDLGARTLEREFNGLGAVAALWVGTSEGWWEARGAWGLGEPLPPESASPGEDPPSWLLQEAPMAAEVWLGRLAPETYRGGLSVEPDEVWVRWAR